VQFFLTKKFHHFAEAKKSAKRRDIMTRHANKKHIDRTTSDLQEAELAWGVSHRFGPLFSSDDEAREAWILNRPRLMSLFAFGGRRPLGWWKFEAPFAYPGFNREKSALWEANLLGAAERRALEASWREEFSKSLEPNFTFRGREGHYLTGRAAHIAPNEQSRAQ
jgi:hypothetical protein